MYFFLLEILIPPYCVRLLTLALSYSGCEARTILLRQRVGGWFIEHPKTAGLVSSCCHLEISKRHCSEDSHSSHGRSECAAATTVTASVRLNTSCRQG
ncbi:hypothetical protein P154DRAFT_130705 [Amniculicola lignicola CBS 123094]|uniref:Secreted protein n=1 Tax=Amniculicola lignicola CBS 123094 TaxID=1392246 RepID=A0A6A5WM67_9PLEO|nr:hypothetical protein P154DRAFT_130705 [Amniculicola lignicola CBS 123094]